MADARTKAEIDEVVMQAVDSIETGESRFPGLTYEEGVDAALRWVTGDTEEEPMSE